MTHDDKVKTLNDMGIYIHDDCPSDYGFFESKICRSDDNCADCWIKTLEDTP